MTRILKLVWAIVLTSVCTSNLIAQSSDWYIGATNGRDWMDVLKQAGFNTDTVCYPTFLCPENPEGYRWFYDLETDKGEDVEISIGKSIKEYRVELALVLASHEIRQIYDSLTFLDHSPVKLDENSQYFGEVDSWIGSILVNGLMLNTYRDFRMSNSIPLTTYIGVGLGVSRVQIEDLFFWASYGCNNINEPCVDQQISRFNVYQHTDLEDVVWALNVSAGIDYEINSQLLMGLKLVHRKTDDLVQSASYLRHPIPDATNTTRISKLNSWSLSLSIKIKR